LQDEVDRIMAKAEAGGALGVGTERYAAGPPASALPEGAALRPVRVHYARWVLGWLGHAFKAILLSKLVSVLTRRPKSI
jgi:hypothetical protein